MKSSAFSFLKTAGALQVFGVASCVAIIAAFASGRYYLCAAPFVALVFISAYVVPQTVVFLFIASFFWGRFLFEKHIITVTATDAAFTLILIAWSGPIVFEGRRMRAKAEDGIRRILMLFLIWSSFTVAVNAYNYDKAQMAVSFWWVVKCGEMVLCFLVAADMLRAVKKEHIIHFILFLGAMQAPVVVWQYRNLGINQAFILKRSFITGTLGVHHSMLGLMMMVAIALAISQIITARRLLYRCGYGFLCLTYLAIIILSGSRSILIGIPVAALVWAVQEYKARPKTVIGFSLAGIAVSAGAIVSPPGKTFLDSLLYGETGYDISSVSRLFIWEGAVRHFMSAHLWHKLTGVGLGAYPTIVYDFVIWGGKRFISGAHNNYLHALLETGVIGLLLYIVLFVRIMLSLYRRRHKSVLAYAGFYLTIVLLVSSLTQETFWFQAAFGSFWMFYMVIITLAIDGGLSGRKGLPAPGDERGWERRASPAPG